MPLKPRARAKIETTVPPEVISFFRYGWHAYELEEPNSGQRVVVFLLIGQLKNHPGADRKLWEQHRDECLRMVHVKSWWAHLELESKRIITSGSGCSGKRSRKGLGGS
jgi:hypothetical protein